VIPAEAPKGTNRGARIRTGDLADPNGARYQAAPRPDERTSMPRRTQPQELLIVVQAQPRTGGLSTAGSGAARTAATRTSLPTHMRFSDRHVELRTIPTTDHIPIIELPDIVLESARLLDPTGFEDLGPNGLQVSGAFEVRRIVTGVSAQVELFERAAELDAQLVLVHHGLFWNFHPPGLDRRRLERLRVLLEHDLSLLAYHLPLDAHPEIGNNALLAKALGCESHEPFGLYRERAIGRLGRFPEVEGIGVGELVERVSAATGGRTPLLQGAGPDRVRTIGIVSGSAADSLDEAIERGCDAFLTGEPREHVMADAREAGIHFLAAGHYATETHGIRALGERLSERFGIEHVFVDLPNPV